MNVNKEPWENEITIETLPTNGKKLKLTAQKHLYGFIILFQKSPQGRTINVRKNRRSGG